MLPSGQPAGPTAGGLAYLALGDSYTIGEGAAADERWPVQLATLGRKRGIMLAEPEIIARTGWTTGDLSAAIANARLTKTYDLVSLLIGVNNQYQGQSVAMYRTEFRQLLGTALGLAGNRPQRVVVLSIPDWGQSPFANGQDRARIGAEIDQFNAAARQECQSRDIAFIDITPLTRAAAGDNNQFTRDRLHYSGAQMGKWAELVLPTVETVLK
ncbi:SGNH/GDSL hydrolase family protein [Hymenobacter sp. B1770]|uniref:SGNH/GDSL hydrolase family protein n=1 Tax=Hymenobacter sp. B1770 TaxID=1718788 RepID=UPI003CF517BC